MASEHTPLVYGSTGRGLEEGRDEEGDKRLSSGRHTCMNDYTKSFVFGGFDGIVASLSVVSGAAGGGLSYQTVLVVGLASVLASALSVGVSEYLSSKAHREFLKAEKRRELWEFKNYRDVEVMEMANRFEARGMDRKDAELVVGKMAQYENFFVTLMVAEELGLQLPEDDDAELLTDAFAMCLSHGLFGLLPVALVCLEPMGIASPHMLYMWAVGASLLVLCVLAAIKSTFSSATALHAGAEAVCLGLVCSVLAYTTGAGAARMLGL